MKKIKLAGIILLFGMGFSSSSCTNKKCWIFSDCLGNDVTSLCQMTESEAADYAQSHGSAGCTWSYRED